MLEERPVAEPLQDDLIYKEGRCVMTKSVQAKVVQLMHAGFLDGDRVKALRLEERHGLCHLSEPEPALGLIQPKPGLGDPAFLPLIAHRQCSTSVMWIKSPHLTYPPHHHPLGSAISPAPAVHFRSP